MGSLSEYGRPAGAVPRIGWHIVWCPKSRKCVLVGAVTSRLQALLGEKATERGWTVEALQVMPDHVHLVVGTGPDASAALLAHQLKGVRFAGAPRRVPHLRSRRPTLWSKSSFAASVGRVSATTIRRYAEEQTSRPEKGRR